MATVIKHKNQEFREKKTLPKSGKRYKIKAKTMAIEFKPADYTNSICS